MTFESHKPVKSKQKLFTISGLFWILQPPISEGGNKERAKKSKFAIFDITLGCFRPEKKSNERKKEKKNCTIYVQEV